VKKLLVRLLLVLAGVAGLTIPAKAQALVEVQIPFQFVVAGQTFPAGEYKITRLSDVQSRILLLPRNSGQAAAGTGVTWYPRLAAFHLSCLTWSSRCLSS